MSEAKVIRMPGAAPAAAEGRKSIPPIQAAVDALPLNSGTWRVEGSMGLYVRCRAKSKSFLVQRKVAGKLVQKVIGQVSLAEARRRAQAIWRELRPEPEGGVPTLEEAWRRYVEDKHLRPSTRAGYLQMLGYVPESWRRRDLRQIGEDRIGVRRLFDTLKRERGAGLAGYTYRVFRAVYAWWRRVLPELPENPAAVVELPPVPSRDWAMDAAALRRWWARVQAMRPARKMLHLLMLLTGCRVGSALRLRWSDIDFERRIIHFSHTKTRPYSVPMSGWLEHWLRRYQDDAAPSEWVFPSPYRVDQPMASQVKEKGIPSPHALRHTARTVLAELGCPIETAKVLLGHSLQSSVSEKYITPSLLAEPARPWAEKLAERYAEILGWER